MLAKDEFVNVHLQRLDRYIKEITGGTIIVSNYEKKSVEYYLRLKEKHQQYWKPENLVRVLRFFSFLRIPTVSAGIIQAEIMPFQLLWLSVIYCAYSDSKTRLIKQCILSTGKKQSKSTWCGLVSLNELLNDSEDGARIMIGANSTRQATIIIKIISDIVENSLLLKDNIDVWKSSIIHHGKSMDNIITAVSTDGKNIQGLNTSVSIVDEFCFAKSMDIAQKLLTGSASRTNPLQLLISTAGESRSTEAYEVITMGKNILDEIVENDSTFVFLAELDSVEESDDVNEIILRKANPALGYTVTSTGLMTAYEKAKLSSTDLAAFKRDHLNMWSEDIGQGLWVDLDIIKSNMREYRSKFLSSTGSTSCVLTGSSLQLVTNKIIPQLSLPLGSKVIIGCDFSSVSDFTGLNVLTYNKEKDEFYSENIVILPSNQRVVTRKGGLSMQKWIDSGAIIQNNLPVLDDELVLEIFRELKRRYKIENIGYDERLSGIMIQKIQYKLGLECTPVKQDAYSLGKPLNLMEKYLTLGKYLIAPNETIVYQAKQIVIWSDGNGNKKIMKNGSRDSVDNWVAANIAMNIWLRDHEYLFSERK